MDVHGRWHKDGGREREGKKRPVRSEDPKMRKAAVEDSRAELAIALSGCDAGTARRADSALDLIASMVLDASGQMTKVPRSRNYRDVTLGELADWVCGEKNGLSDVSRWYGRTQHTRRMIDEAFR